MDQMYCKESYTFPAAVINDVSLKVSNIKMSFCLPCGNSSPFYLSGISEIHIRTQLEASFKWPFTELHFFGPFPHWSHFLTREIAAHLSSEKV